MADVVDKAARSQMMSGIRGKNTKPELLVRYALHRHGFRYRLHDRTVSGTPDMIFRKYRAVIFINGCFWHMHSCHLFKWPSTNSDFWSNKISNNYNRDKLTKEKLLAEGWRILYIWECALKGKTKLSMEHITKVTAEWLVSDSKFLEIP